MIEYTPKERLFRVLHKQTVDRMPAVCFTQTATVEQMESIGSFWPESHENPQKMALLAEAAHTVVGFEAIRVPFDITAEAEFFGCKLKAGTKEQQPSVIGHSVTTIEDIESIKNFEFGKNTRCDRILESIDIVSKKYGSTLPIIGSMIGPFSLAQHLNGDNWFMNIFTNDPVVLPLIELATKFNIEYAKKMIENGADTIVIIDPTASYELLGQEFYEKFAVPYHKMIVDALREYNISTILHICGNTTDGIELMDQAGFNAISVDQKVNIKLAVSRAKNAIIVGNLDPVELLWKGNPEMIKEKCSYIFDEGSKIVTAGCGIVSATPNENLKALVEYAKGRYY